MANLPDPIGRVVRDLGMVRGEARIAFLRLPATDPLRPILDQVDKILGVAERNITKVTGQVTTQAKRTPREIVKQVERMAGGPRPWRD